MYLNTVQPVKLIVADIFDKIGVDDMFDNNYRNGGR